MVGGAAVMFGATGVWVGMTDLPASTVLCMRMAPGRRHWSRCSAGRADGCGSRAGRACGGACSLLGLLDALQLYTFMLALRHLDVALAVFLSYMSPIYIALVAPRLLRQRTEPVVVVALVLAVAGIVVMLAPGLMGTALRVSPLGSGGGPDTGCAARGLLPGRQDAQRRRRWEHHAHLERRDRGGGHAATRPDPVGRSRLPVRGHGLLGGGGVGGLQHRVRGHHLPPRHALHPRAAHLDFVGLLEPASAPVFALLFLAERPSLWTLLGGVLILVGAVLVV